MNLPVNLKELSDIVNESHKNFIVSEINDSCLRLAVNEGEYPWHYHSNSDELFIVLEGELTIEFQDEPIGMQYKISKDDPKCEIIQLRRISAGHKSGRSLGTFAPKRDNR